MSRYWGDPLRLRVLGLESHVRTRHLGPGTLRVGRRRFWVEDVEIVIRYSVPAVWQPGPSTARPPGAASPGGRR